MGDHLPILQVILPLIAAPLCLLVRHAATCWLIATLVSWLCLAIAVLLLLQVLDGGTIRYQLGNWVAPWGIEYVVDRLNGFILVIVASIGAVVAPLRAAQRERRAAGAADRPVLCDVSAVPFRPARHYDHRRRLQRLRLPRNLVPVVLRADQHGAAPQGVARCLPVSGHGHDRGDLLPDRRRPALHDDRHPQHGRSGGAAQTDCRFAHRAGGLRLHRRRHGAQAGGLPLHLWLPNAYAHAPSAVSVFLAGTATKVSLYVVLRFIFTVFGFEFSFVGQPLGPALLVLAIAGIVVCSLVAIYQVDVKRLLAWSSVAQIGYMLLGLSFATAIGLQAGLLHIFNHAIIKAGLFLAMGCVFLRLGSCRLDAIAGVGRRMPWTMMGFLLCGLSLIGVPPTGRFREQMVSGAGGAGKRLVAGRGADRPHFPDGARLHLEGRGSGLVPGCLRGHEQGPGGAAFDAGPALGRRCRHLWFGLETSGNVDVAKAAAAALMGAVQ